jgi:hypothetical protein
MNFAGGCRALKADGDAALSVSDSRAFSSRIERFHPSVASNCDSREATPAAQG